MWTTQGSFPPIKGGQGAPKRCTSRSPRSPSRRTTAATKTLPAVAALRRRRLAPRRRLVRRRPCAAIASMMSSTTLGNASPRCSSLSSSWSAAGFYPPIHRGRGSAAGSSPTYSAESVCSITRSTRRRQDHTCGYHGGVARATLDRGSRRDNTSPREQPRLFAGIDARSSSTSSSTKHFRTSTTRVRRPLPPLLQADLGYRASRNFLFCATRSPTVVSEPGCVGCRYG